MVRANLDAINAHASKEMDIKIREILLEEFKQGIWTVEEYREQVAHFSDSHSAKKAHHYSPDWDEDLPGF